MSRYSAYIIQQEGVDQPIFGVIEDNGFNPGLELPVSNGKSQVEILQIDPEVVRQFRKKHLGDSGNWDIGNPDDLKMEAYPVLMEMAGRDPKDPAPLPKVDPIPVTVVPPGEKVDASDTRIGSDHFGDRFEKSPSNVPGDDLNRANADRNKEALAPSTTESSKNKAKEKA